MSNFEGMVVTAEPAPCDGLYVFCPGVMQTRSKEISLLNAASNGQTFKNLIESKQNCQKEAVSNIWNVTF